MSRQELVCLGELAQSWPRRMNREELGRRMGERTGEAVSGTAASHWASKLRRSLAGSPIMVSSSGREGLGWGEGNGIYLTITGEDYT